LASLLIPVLLIPCEVHSTRYSFTQNCHIRQTRNLRSTRRAQLVGGGR